MIYNVMNKEKIWFKKEPKEKKIYKESTLYHRIRNILKDAGYDVVRQVPAKDGHLTSAPYYIRDRRGRFCWINRHYALYSLLEIFNDGVEITLDYHDLTEE